MAKIRDLPPEIRIVAGRGLGPDERDGEWVDREGDRWRYNHGKKYWEYKLCRPGIASSWLTVNYLVDGFTSPDYAPYRRVRLNPAPPATSPAAGVGRRDDELHKQALELCAGAMNFAFNLTPDQRQAALDIAHQLFNVDDALAEAITNVMLAGTSGHFATSVEDAP